MISAFPPFKYVFFKTAAMRLKVGESVVIRQLQKLNYCAAAP